MRTAIAGLWLTLREATRVAIYPQARREVLHTPLYANSVYLMGNSATSAGLGFIVLGDSSPATSQGMERGAGMRRENLRRIRKGYWSEENKKAVGRGETRSAGEYKGGWRWSFGLIVRECTT